MTPDQTPVVMQPASNGAGGHTYHLIVPVDPDVNPHAYREAVQVGLILLADQIEDVQAGRPAGGATVLPPTKELGRVARLTIVQSVCPTTAASLLTETRRVLLRHLQGQQ